jgi:hypothetical protein
LEDLEERALEVVLEALALELEAVPQPHHSVLELALVLPLSASVLEAVLRRLVLGQGAAHQQHHSVLEQVLELHPPSVSELAPALLLCPQLRSLERHRRQQLQRPL